MLQRLLGLVCGDRLTGSNDVCSCVSPADNATGGKADLAEVSTDMLDRILPMWLSDDTIVRVCVCVCVCERASQ